MNNSSKSTLLLNCLVALCHKNPNFPSTLFENGYQLECLDYPFLLQDGSKVKPDVQLKKNDDYLLFFECKDGSVDADQLERYKKIKKEDLLRSKITSLPASSLQFDLGYFGTEKNKDKLLTSIEKNTNPFPIVVLDSNRILWQDKSPQFNNHLTQKVFSEIKFETPVPTGFIPFTPDDDDDVIKIALLQHLHAKFDSEFTLDELINELFAHVVNYYSPEAKSSLKGRIGALMAQILALPEFLEMITLHEKKYRVKPSTPKKFRSACIKLIDKFQKNAHRRPLSDWF